MSVWCQFYVMSTIKHADEQIVLIHTQILASSHINRRSGHTKSTTGSCTGSCKGEAKHRERLRMTPASMELSNKQPPHVGQFLLGECWMGHMLSVCSQCWILLTCIKVTFNNLGSH